MTVDSEEYIAPEPSPGREEDHKKGALQMYMAGLADCFPYYVEVEPGIAHIISAHLIEAGGGHAITSEPGTKRRIYLSNFSSGLLKDLVKGGAKLW